MNPLTEFWKRQTGGREDGPRLEYESPLTLNDLFIEDRRVVMDAKGQVDCIQFKVWLTDDDGVMRPYWKAVKLGRIVRVPVWLREDVKLMQLQDDIIAGAWESGLNYITLLANIIKPKPFGLLQCYGVQVLGDSPEEVRYLANQDYHALTAMLTGSFRGIEYRPLRDGEAEWLRDKMATMKNLIMLRGIPSPRNTAALVNMSSMMGGEKDTQSEEQMEQFARGMSTREFVFLLLSSPMDTKSLSSWLTVVSQEMTKWKSQMQGSRVISAGLSMPMAFSSNIGSASAASHGVATGETTGQTIGHSESVGLAHSLTLSNQVSHGQSEGVTQGFSLTNNATQSVGQGASLGHAVGVSEQASVGQNFSHGVNESQSLSVGQSHTQSVGSSFGESMQQSQSHGVSDQSSLSQGHSVGTSLSSSHGLSVGQSQQTSISQGYSDGMNQSNSSSQTLSHGLTDTSSQQLSSSQGIGNSQGYSDSRSTGASEGAAVNHSVSDGSAVNNMVNNSISANGRVGIGFAGVGGGAAHGDGTSASNQIGQSTGGSNTIGYNNSDSTSYSGGVSHNSSVSEGASSSVGQSTTDSTGISHSAGSSQNWSTGVSQSAGQNQSSSFTTGQSESATNTTGASYGVGQNWSQSSGDGVSAQQTSSTSNGTSAGMSQSAGQSWSSGGSQSVSSGVNQQDSATNQISQTDGRGLSLGSTKGFSDTSSTSVSQGVSQGTTASQTQGASSSESAGQSQTQSMANQVSDSLGSGSNLSVGPFFSLSKSFQWVDVSVENLVAVMQHQRERLLQSLQGQGAMYSDVYILVDDEEARSAATAVAKTAFYGDVFPTPLEVMVLTPEEQMHQAYHAEAFSSCNAREPIPNLMDAFRYSTVLLAREMAAYTHPLRVELGGASTVTENIPILRVNPERTGEVYHGVQVSGERWDPELGYKTPFQWRISRDELMHTNISGRSGSGKTVGATRFIAETYNNMTFGPDPETGEERRMSAIILDWKRDWRILKRFVPENRFRFMSLSDPNLNPIRFNLLAVPQGIYPQHWLNAVIEVFCLSFSMGGRAKSLLWQHITDLYTKYGVYDNPENSRRITMYELYQVVAAYQKSLSDIEKGKTARVGNDTKDAYQRVLDRLVYFSDRVYRTLYCDTSADALSITDIVSAKNTVTVMEANGLDGEMKQFIIGVLAAGIYQYTVANDKYDPGLLLVFEEAHEVLKGSGADAGGGDSGSSVLNTGETIYEQMWNEARGYNLFLVSISQMPSHLPSSVISNSSLVYSYALDDAKDREVMMKKIARDPRYDHREIERFFPRMPIGWCIAKSSRVQDYKDADPSIVATDPLIAEPVTNDELRRQPSHTSV